MTDFEIDFINFAKRMYIIYGKFPTIDDEFDNESLANEYWQLTETYQDDELDTLFDGYLFQDDIQTNNSVKFTKFFVDVVMGLPQEKYNVMRKLFPVYQQKELAIYWDTVYNTTLAEQFEFIIKQEMNNAPKKWR